MSSPPRQASLAARPHPSSHLPRAHAVFHVRDDGVRLGALALHLPALDHERSSRAQPRGHPAQRRAAADLLATARAVGAARAIARIAAGIRAKDASSVVPLLFARYFPGLVRRGRRCCNRHRRARACCDHEHRRGESCSQATSFASSRRNARPWRRSIAKVFTLAFARFALLFIFFVPVPYAIDFQLLGGALMLQIFPAFVLGLWTRWFHPKALLAGWACGLLASCAMAYARGFTPNYTLHAFGGYAHGVHRASTHCYSTCS